MKLLLDQNISYRLVKSMETLFPATRHVTDLGLTNSSDLDIWKFAGRENYTIVTFDSDFYNFSLLYPPPPKIILIRSRNQTSSHIMEILEQKFDLIQEFIISEKQREIRCLELID